MVKFYRTTISCHPAPMKLENPWINPVIISSSIDPGHQWKDSTISPDLQMNSSFCRMILPTANNREKNPLFSSSFGFRILFTTRICENSHQISGVTLQMWGLHSCCWFQGRLVPPQNHPFFLRRWSLCWLSSRMLTYRAISATQANHINSMGATGARFCFFPAVSKILESHMLLQITSYQWSRFVIMVMTTRIARMIDKVK